MKIVYQLDRAGTYMGEVEADVSPLEPNVYLIPAGCIESSIVPPSVQEDEVVQWTGANWVVSKVVTPDDSDPQPSETEVAIMWRDAELKRSDIELYKSQDGMPNTVSVSLWRKYRVNLRNWPEDPNFPSMESRPIAPDIT